MTVCSHCGAQLQGDERFCVACGAVVAANGPAVPRPVTGVAVAPLPPAAPARPAAYPGGYAAAGSIPVVVGAPQAPANRGGMMWVAIVVVVLLAGAYYYSKEKPAAATTPAAPAQPGTPAPPVDDATLVLQQSVGGHWKAIYGYVEVTNAAWTNHSSIAIQSATLECDQYSANGGELSQMRTTLNGPVQPGGTANFNPFQMGSVSTYMSRVNCEIVGITRAS